MSKRIPRPTSGTKGAAGPITAPQAATKPEYAVPENVRALLGPSWLIEGEDPKRYEEVLGRVGAAVQPTDIIDWLLLKDVVALSWEIQRSRRQRDTLVRMGRLEALMQILREAIPREGWFGDFGRDGEISRLASEWLRVLIKDSPENCGFFGEGVNIIVEVVVDPQRQVDHFDNLGDDLCAAAEPREKVADVAVVLFDGDGQVFAGEKLVVRDEAVIALPIIGDERLIFDADFVEELLACGVITATKNPGDGSPSNRVIGSPKPEFLSLFFTKCHISSRVTTTTSALVDGSGSLRASSRTQFRTATSLTPRMRAMEPKLTLPMA